MTVYSSESIVTRNMDFIIRLAAPSILKLLKLSSRRLTSPNPLFISTRHADATRTECPLTPSCGHSPAVGQRVQGSEGRVPTGDAIS